jgi:hypothetical protein
MQFFSCSAVYFDDFTSPNPSLLRRGMGRSVWATELDKVAIQQASGGSYASDG